MGNNRFNNLPNNDINNAFNNFETVGSATTYPETNDDPNVKCLFYFDEPSGSIVDEISGITLSVVGAPVFEVASTGDFAGISPGITYASNKQHRKTTASATLNVGATDDIVAEWYAMSTAGMAAAGSRTFWAYNLNATDDFGILTYALSTTVVVIYLKSDDNSTVYNEFTTPNWADGEIHKFRAVFDRSGNLELFFDGVSCGTISMADVAGDTFTNAGLRMAGQYNDGGNDFVGTLYTFRLSIGNDVIDNNLGGPGGG